MSDSSTTISAFLADVGRRLARYQIARSLLKMAALAAVLAAAVPLLSSALPQMAPALAALAVMATAAMFLGVILSIWFAKQRWSEATAVALYVGDREPAIASDLLSTVEFARQERPEFSTALVSALTKSTSTRVGQLNPQRLVSWRPLHRPFAFAVVGIAALSAGLVFAPITMASGWANMMGSTTEAPFDGATQTTGPVVGDVEITLRFPTYTQRPEVTLPASAGDFRAMPGTVATIQTTALHRAISADIVFGTDGRNSDSDSEHESIPLAVDDGKLSAELTVTTANVYRFLLREPGGHKRVEAVGHRIEIEPDNAPLVELHTPADELDVSNQKRVELAYITTDDYGITKVELVWRAQGKTVRHQLPLAEPSPGRARLSAQSKHIWDLSLVDLPSGGVIPYHLEVSDNDTVNGPNIGKSKSFTLRVFSPRERHEALVDDQRKLFEKLIKILGGRLTSAAEDLEVHRELERATSEVVVDLGTLVSALSDDKLASAELTELLDQFRTRYDRFSKRERAILEKALSRGRAGRSTQRLESSLAALDREQTTTLENDVIALMSWLDRQDLEGMLHINDEIKTHRERLDKLLTELNRSGDPSIHAEIERELRALESKLAEIGNKSSDMRTDVLDQFVNREAATVDQKKGCLVIVRELLTTGEHAAAAEQMKKCSQELADSTAAMEQALAGLRTDRFSDEQKEIGELMNSLADLAQDEDDLAKAIDDIYQDYAEKAAALSTKATKASSDKRNKLSKAAEALKKRLGNISEAALTPFAKEELKAIKARSKDIIRMLTDGDLAEALAMSRQAEAGLESLAAELDADIEDGEPWNKKTPNALERARRIQEIAQRLTDNLRAATPAPRDVMDRAARKRLERMLARQKKLRQRAKQVGRNTNGAKHLPQGVGAMVAQKLKLADGKMDGVSRRLRATDPSGARHQAHEAADFLRELTRDAQRQTRGGQAQGRTGLRDEPVRIPGAEEYKAPADLREELLDAMKKGGPTNYKDMNKRYYEELIK